MYVIVFFAGEIVAFFVMYLVSRAEPTGACLEKRCDRCVRLGHDCVGMKTQSEEMAERDLAAWRLARQVWNRKN